MEQRISLITLRVDSMTRARAFYEGLGWEPTAGSQDNIIFFQMGGLGLALIAAAEYDREIGGDGPPPPSGPVMLAHNVRGRGEVDRLVSFALTQGARLVRPPADQIWGGYSGTFADPDGHFWEIAWNPFWPLADDGSVTVA